MYHTLRKVLAPVWLTVFLLASTGPCVLLAQGVVFRPAARIHTKKHAGTSMALAPSSQSGPDTLTTALGRPKLEHAERPLPRETVAEGGELVQVSPTEVKQIIPINRVVSYATKEDGTLYPCVEATGAVSHNARLTVFVRMKPDNAVDNRKKVRLVFTALNGIPLANVWVDYLLGEDYIKLATPQMVPTSALKFANAVFNPLTVSASQIQASPQTYAAKPGKNELSFQSYSDPDGVAPLVGHYTAWVYAFLEFDAVAPILMVHGTNAQHDTWYEPSVGTRVNSIDLGPFVSSNLLLDGFFNYSSLNIDHYQGVWYHNINLGASLLKPGNAGIDASGRELAGFVTAVLDALGSRTCHIIAHSKGGSDSREMIAFMSGTSLAQSNSNLSQNLAVAGTNNINDLLYKYQILSLYTIGTPHLGTPLSDISVAMMPWAYSFARGISTDSDVEAIASNSLATINLFIGPDGQALRDQVVDTRIKQYTSDNSFNFTNNHFYSIVGDADLNSDTIITNDEKKTIFLNILFDSTAFDSVATHMYSVVGRVESVSINTPAVAVGPFIFVELIPTIKNKIIIPNDLITPIWSGIGPGAETLSIYISGLFTSSHIVDNQLTPGNHSLLKNNRVAEQLIFHIFQKYPLCFN